MKTLHIDLMRSDLSEYLKAVQDLKQRLEQRIPEARRQIAELIATQARQNFSGTIVDRYWTATGDSTPTTIPASANVEVVDVDSNTTEVLVNGEGVLFVEFGTGIALNGSAGSSPHPVGNEVHMTIGGYGTGHGRREMWYFKSENGGERMHTEGIPAQLPLWRAFLAVKLQIDSIVKGALGL